MQKLRNGLAAALAAPTVDTNQLPALADAISMVPSEDKARDIWFAQYGRGTLSTYLLFHESFERKVFAVDFPDEQDASLALMRDCLSGRHPCDVADIQSLSIEERWIQRGVLVASVKVRRGRLYSVQAQGVFYRRKPEDDWRLVYLGVKNRLSHKLAMSRPIYTADVRWKDIGHALEILGIGGDVEASDDNPRANGVGPEGSGVGP